MSEFPAIVRRAVDSLIEQSADVLPRLLASIAMIVLGLIVAAIVRVAVRAVLKRIGLDRLSDSIGLSRVLGRLGIQTTLSEWVGLLLFWIVFALFVLSATDALGLPAVSELISRIIALLPTLALVALVLLIGLSLARLARRTVAGVAERSAFAYAETLGQIAYIAIVGLTVIITLSGLGIDLTVVTALLVVIMATGGITFAFTLGLGARGVARNTIDGIYARKEIKVGDRIRLADVSGEVVSLGRVTLTLKDGDRTWLVPYRRLLDSVVEIVSDRDSGA